jgi:hypothetical protein
MASAQVHTHLDSTVWWTDRRPKTLRLEGRNDHFDHSDALKDVFEREGLGRNGENIKEEHVQQMMDIAGIRDMQEYAKDLERAAKSDELRRCACIACIYCKFDVSQVPYTLFQAEYLPHALKINTHGNSCVPEAHNLHKCIAQLWIWHVHHTSSLCIIHSIIIWYLLRCPTQYCHGSLKCSLYMSAFLCIRACHGP